MLRPQETGELRRAGSPWMGTRVSWKYETSFVQNVSFIPAESTGTFLFICPKIFTQTRAQVFSLSHLVPVR